MEKYISKKSYCRVTLDLTKGSVYEYRYTDAIPTKIKFGRMYSGKFQKGEIKGNFTNIKLHDIIFLIKRGCELSDIDEQIKLDY